MLWRLIAVSIALLSLLTCVVSAPFTEDDVADHHFVVGSVDALDVDGAGGGVDFWASKLVDDLIAAPFSFFHWPGAAGPAMFDPVSFNLAFEDFDFGSHLNVLCFTRDPSPLFAW